MDRARVSAILRIALPLAIAAAIFAFAPTAWAASSVGGTVTSAITEGPLGGIRVDAYAYDPLYQDWEVWDWTVTAADGTYSLGDLPDGTYRIGFYDPDQNYREQYWDDEPSVSFADPVTVADGSPVTGIDATMEGLAPSVTGHVTAEGSGDPVVGALVEAYAFDGASWEPTGTPTFTGADGGYQLFLLGDGTYRIGADDFASGRYTEGFYGGDSIDSALSVSTAQGETTSGIDFTLPDETVPPDVFASVDSTYTSPAEIAITATDDGSGVASVSYVLDHDSTVTVPGSSAGVEVTAAGTHTLEYWATDHAGNESDHQDAAFAVVAPIPPPTVSCDATSSYVGTASVTITGKDTGGPGVASVSYRLDSASTETVSAESTTVVVTAVGPHALEFWSTDTSGTSSVHGSAAFAVVEPAPEPPHAADKTVRIAGVDRFDTAVQVALAERPGWSGLHNVVLTSGDDRFAAETLSAPGLSWAYRGVPILLGSSRSTPLATKNAVLGIVNANGAVTLRVVGGKSSIPNARIDEIRRFVARQKHWSMARARKNVRFDRITASDDRYKVAAAVAVRMRKVRPRDFPRRALVANGSTSRLYLDDTALGPIAARTGAPILLVTATKVPAATAAALKATRVRASGIVAYGSATDLTAAVTRRLGVSSANRVASPTQAGGAALLADASIARGWLAENPVGVAASRCEALVGAPLLAAAPGAPLLFATATAAPPETSAWLAAHKAGITRIYLLGAPGQLSPTAAAEVNAAAN